MGPAASRELLRLLAESRINDAQLRQLEQWVRESKPGALVHEIAKLRSRLHIDDGPDSEPTHRADASMVVAAVHQVRQLLQKESGLSVTEAASALLPRLTAHVRDPFEAKDLTPRSKEGFDRWALRLVRAIPLNVVLSEATRVRNAHVHRLGDWPLLEEEK